MGTTQEVGIDISRRRQKRKRLKPWQRDRRKMLLLILVGAVFLGYLPAKRVMMTKSLRDTVDGIRAEEYPTSFEELAAWKGSVVDGENAALIYVEAFGAYNATYVTFPPDVMDLLPLITIPRLESNVVIDDATWDAVGTFLEINALSLGLIHEAAALPHCRFPTDYSDGGTVGLPELTQFDHLVKLICLEALFGVHIGDIEKTESALLMAFEVTRSIQDERNTWSYVERGDALQNILDTLTWAFGKCSFSDEALVRLSDALVVQGDREFVREALIGDLGQMLGMMTLMDEQIRNDDPSSLIIESLFGLNTQYFDFLLGAHARILDAAELPRHEGLVAARIVQVDLNEEFLYGLSSAYWKATLSPFANLEAKVEIGRATVAIERFRLIHGGIPSEFEELVPELLDAVPIDPFVGDALRYVVGDAGYKVYSVDNNGVDDGGLMKKDIVFSVGTGQS